MFLHLNQNVVTDLAKSNPAMLRWQQSYPEDASRISILMLPAEIRTLIIEEVLPKRQRCVRQKSYWSWSAQKLKSSRCITSFLRSCRQLHAEGSSVFYSSNIFDCQYAFTGSEKGWSKNAASSFGDLYIPLIRHAVIEADDWIPQKNHKYSITDQLRRLADAWPNLKTLMVEFTDEEVDDLKRIMRKGRTAWTAENIAQEIR